MRTSFKLSRFVNKYQGSCLECVFHSNDFNINNRIAIGIITVLSAIFAVFLYVGKLLAKVDQNTLDINDNVKNFGEKIEQIKQQITLTTTQAITYKIRLLHL